MMQIRPLSLLTNLASKNQQGISQILPLPVTEVSFVHQPLFWRGKKPVTQSVKHGCLVQPRTSSKNHLFSPFIVGVTALPASLPLFFCASCFIVASCFFLIFVSPFFLLIHSFRFGESASSSPSSLSSSSPSHFSLSQCVLPGMELIDFLTRMPTHTHLLFVQQIISFLSFFLFHSLLPSLTFAFLHFPDSSLFLLFVCSFPHPCFTSCLRLLR